MARLYVTPLTAGRSHAGAAVATIGAALGTPFMPHQREVAALATERDGDRWAYNTIVVAWPRQSGKTTVRGPLAIHRCLTIPGARCWLTAQTRQDARDILVDEVGPRFTRSPLARFGRLRRSQGSEGIYFRSGSAWRVFAPQSNERGSNTIHGKANHLVDVDEAFALDEVTGAAIEQAVIPSFTTTGGQMSIVSTAGYASSAWLRGYVDAGRAAVAADERTGTALVEYGLTAEQAGEVRDGLEDEPDSPRWAAAVELLAREHPAYGVTLVPETIAQYARLPRVTIDAVLRAYGNVWTIAETSAFPLGSWDAAGSEAPTQPTTPALAFDVTPNGERAAVVAAWRTGDGTAWVEVIDERAGTSWLVPALLELERAYRTTIGYDTGGPSTLAVADALARARPGLRLRGLNTREYAAACSVIYAAVVAGTLHHTRQPVLDTAVEAAAQRPLLDAGFGWTRKGSTASIAPLVAATIALRVADETPAARLTTALSAAR